MITIKLIKMIIITSINLNYKGICLFINKLKYKQNGTK